MSNSKFEALYREIQHIASKTANNAPSLQQEDIDRLERIMGTVTTSSSVTGYSFHSDSQYTEASPYVIPQGQKLKLPNDNLGFKKIDQLPKGYQPFYDGNVIKAKNNDSIALAVRFRVKSSINQGGLVYTLDIAGNQGEIIGDSRRLLRTAGVENPINFESSPFTGETFNGNGGEVYLEAVAGTLSVYDISYKITLSHEGR